MKIVANLNVETGPLCYGATGFLYGMSHEGIPSDTMLSGLKLRVLAQKAPGGLQHPGGDAFEVADQFFRNGGARIQIYLQDFYASWPYPYNIDDYRQVVERMALKVKEHPHRKRFVYVPLNEPDSNGYNKVERFAVFLADWKALVQIIRKADPGAKVAGPCFGTYDSPFLLQFLRFCVENQCLPDEIVWHELDDNFYSQWYAKVADYRRLEALLGIAPLPIVINEYVKNQQELSNPGVLVQHIARFETSKVEACLAYWCRAGRLNDLVTANDNQATSAWWVFHWYGQMTGHTIEVTPPDLNAKGLAGLASFDAAKTQVRMLLAGSQGTVEAEIQGLTKEWGFGEAVCLTVWSVANSGKRVSEGPQLEQTGVFPVAGLGLKFTLERMVSDSAYYLVVTPFSGKANFVVGQYSAQFSNLLNGAKISYEPTGDGGCVELTAEPGEAAVLFYVTTESDGYQHLQLKGSVESAHIGTGDGLGLTIDGRAYQRLPFASALRQDSSVLGQTVVFLSAGIHALEFGTISSTRGLNVKISSLVVNPTKGPIEVYEAQSAVNTVGGNAERFADPAASGGEAVRRIGAGAENFLQFNQVVVPEPGRYFMVIRYANNEMGNGAGSHDNQYLMVDRYADVMVNGAFSQGVYLGNTSGWSNFQTKVVELELQAGPNTIRFSNDRGYVDLALLSQIPPETTWSELEVEGQWRYLRYVGPDGGFANIGEMEFYNAQGEKLTGTPFGTTPSSQPGMEFDKATDGDLETAFEYASEKCGYAGLDLGVVMSVTRIRFYPRKGYAHRMAGGRFQGSRDDSADSCWAPIIDRISLAHKQL